MTGNNLIDNITRAIENNREILSEALIDQEDVTPQELMEYFSGETPTGDVTTIADVIVHPWLLLHELVELKHLKIRGFEISRNLVWENYHEVLEAHIAATAVELKLASRHGDHDWVSARIDLIPSWLEESNMPENLRKFLLELMQHYKK